MTDNTDLQNTVDDLTGNPMVCALMRSDQLITGMFSTDPYAVHATKAILQLLHRAYASEPGKGPLCLGCDTEFNKNTAPVDFWLVHPYLVDWSQAKGKPFLITGICSHCARKEDDELTAVGMRQMKKVWPDLQPMNEGSA